MTCGWNNPAALSQAAPALPFSPARRRLLPFSVTPLLHKKRPRQHASPALSNRETAPKIRTPDLEELG